MPVRDLELTRSKRALHPHRCRQPFQILAPRNLHCAELPRGGRHHLNVEQRETPLAQVLHEVMERDFRRVRDAMEHGFAREKAAEAHAVNAADEFSCPASIRRCARGLAREGVYSLR